MNYASFHASGGVASFEGMERDLQMRIDRGISWLDVIGGPPVPVPFWMSGGSPVIQMNDMVDIQFTLWTGQTNGANIEAFLPAYAPGYTFDLWLPGDSTHGAIPGFGQWDGANNVWKFQKCTLNAPIQSMGRKAPIVPLWGYRFDVHFAGGGAQAGGLQWMNERDGVAPSSSTTTPSILGHKFVAHQINDWSVTAKPLPNAITYTGVQHGRRRDAAIALDHMDVQTMDAVATWFRAIGGAAFSLTTDQPFGPGQSNTCNALAREMTVSRVAGYWEAKIDVSLYQ